MLAAVGRWEHHRHALTTASLGLGMQRYTKGTAVVTLTNLSGFQLFYLGKVERKTDEGWPEYDRYGSVGTLAQGTLLPGEATTLTMPVMDYVQAYPWRISVFCSRGPSMTDEIWFRSQQLALKLHLKHLARHLWADTKVVKVAGPQMEQ
jgi:hypothetical protein